MVVLSAAASLQAQKKPDLRPPLLIAIEKHDVAGVQRAMEQGADVNAPVVEEITFLRLEDTMLLRAMEKGPREITLLLLRAPGIDVNKTGESGNPGDPWIRTPLIQAASMGDAEIVSILLKKGAKVNVRDNHTVPAIMWAKGYPDVVKVLVTESKGLDIDMVYPHDGDDTLWQSSKLEYLDTVKLLVEHGAKIGFTTPDGASILTTTFELKKRDVLDYLIAKGADINHTSKDGSTPLMRAIGETGGKNSKTYYNFIDYFLSTYKPKLDYQVVEAALHVAASVGNLDVINLLLDRGATLELKSLSGGGTALHYAVTHRKPEAVRLLIKRKANIEARNGTGDTPLILAAYNSDPAMVQLLVDSGAAVNVRSLGNVMVTPLAHGATDPNTFNKKNNLAIFNILLSAKADIDFKSGDGTTALMAAARQSNTGLGYELAAFFIGKGANLDLKNNKGETALMLSAGVGNEKLVQLLMDKGADAKIKNGAGETVMSYAKRSPRPGSDALLQSKGLQPDAPIVRKSVIVDALLGTWTGSQEGLSQAVTTVVLNRNGTYDFKSKLTAEAMKYVPKGSMNPTIAAHHGTYTFNDDILIWNPVGTPPTSMHWKLDKGMLILDSKLRLKRAVSKSH